MFVEERPQGEVHTTLKLSEAIRRGKPLISEESTRSFRLCALGCAWAGIRGREMTGDEMADIASRTHRSQFQRTIAADLGFDPALGDMVNEWHCASISALEIAQRLEAQGL